MTSFGIVMEASPGNTAMLAREIEQMGFDALLCPDTQNLSPDPIGQLSLAGAATESLLVGTGVTNPITRDPAVLACSLASLGVETGDERFAVLAAAIPVLRTSAKVMERARSFVTL